MTRVWLAIVAVGVVMLQCIFELLSVIAKLPSSFS